MIQPTSPPLRLDDRTIVGRIRLRASGPLDPASAKRRLESVLGEVGLGDAGLPASTLLCIRSLRDPLPGKLSLAWNARPPSEWKQAIGSEIARVARGAARPIDGAVPAGHEAVVFRDRAELLACLALDWMRGEVAERWWWKHLVGAATTERIAPVQWAAEAPFVPAAAHLLVEREALVPFAAALDPEEARAIVAGLDAAFGLDLASFAPSFVTLVSSPVALRSEDEPAESTTPTAWSRWVPEADAPQIASGPARAFVAMSVGLARASEVVRRPEMRAVLARWLERREGSRPSDRSVETHGSNELTTVASSLVPTPIAVTPPTIADSLPAPRVEAPVSEPSRGAPGLASASMSVPGREREREREAVAGVAQGAESRPASIATGPRADEGVAPHLTPTPPVTLSRVAAEAPGRIPADPAAPSSPAPSPGAERPLPRPTRDGTPVGTGLGGAFFLMNVLLALDIYGDFTRPRSRAVEASPWTLLAHLSRALLGEAGRDVADDPLWWLLRELAGGAGERDVWPSAFRVQPAWLLPFPDRSHWTWSARNGRLRVEHPHEFVVIDAPAEEDVAAQCARELTPYEVIEASEASGVLAAASWPDMLASFVCARLHAALRAESPRESATLALTLRARVRVTGAHVDAHFTLADLPIEVRMAGLDRDPGWVPAAGRFVAFHFE